MRNLRGLFPAADAAQLNIPFQRFQQLPGVAKTINGFGHKATGYRQPILRWPSDPSPATGNKTRQRDHLQRGHKALGRPAQLSHFFFQNWKQTRLQNVGELRDLLTECKLHKGLPNLLVSWKTTAYFDKGPS